MPKDKNNVIPIRPGLTEEEEYTLNCEKIQDLQVEIEMLHDNLTIIGADVSALCELRKTMIALELWSEYVEEGETN